MSSQFCKDCIHNQARMQPLSKGGFQGAPPAVLISEENNRGHMATTLLMWKWDMCMCRYNVATML